MTVMQLVIKIGLQWVQVPTFVSKCSVYNGVIYKLVWLTERNIVFWVESWLLEFWVLTLISKSNIHTDF